MVNKIVLTFWMILLFVGCKTNDYDPSQPPEGFANNTTLKIAYTLGAIEPTITNVEVPESIKEHKDLIYKSIDSTTLKLDIYHLYDLKKDAPLIVFIHGGAWEKGKKSNVLHYLVSYAQKGYVTATIQYRLSGVAKYPAQLLDVEDAVKWLKFHAKDYNINAQKVALAGGSAGGHLAMQYAYSHSYNKVDSNGIPTNVQAVINIYGPSDLTTEIAKKEERVHRLIGKKYEEVPEMYRKASPILFVNKNSPPTISFHGTLDELVPYRQSKKLHETLKTYGVPNYYHELKGWPHSMDLSAKVFSYIQYHTDIFLEKHLKA
ncbi:alpha/beta hydrolase [Arenibacter sp. F20364]|uniref:alpha/beta hydrolase n=1 Tax=Arenibacter sp. F20364 TaxID=2926415 RepID=UPI001FF24B5C|nr:alpha/beta hydrolase [Arenibacter sp. F20364]MCK0189771.1 alpha/beta hydrolase [Arenibacter sp. F20364]